MTLEEINQHLASIATSGDQQFANAAMFIQQVITQIHSGDMSADEAQEVLYDVQRQLQVIQSMEQMALKETLNTVITGLISLSSAV